MIFDLIDIISKNPVFFRKAYKLPHIIMRKFKDRTAF